MHFYTRYCGVGNEQATRFGVVNVALSTTITL
jgi:hypothetical protein